MPTKAERPVNSCSIRVCCRTLAVLFLAAIPIARAQNLPQPAHIWSIGPLKAPPSGASNGTAPSAAPTDVPSSSDATKRIAFAGDRIVLAIPAPTKEGAEESVFRLLSLEAATGDIKDQRDITSLGHPGIFATSDAHILVSGSELIRLTPDLKDAGKFESPYNGQAAHANENMSPDGSKIGQATSSGFRLIDAVTLQPITVTNSPAVGTSVNSKGFLTDNQHWSGESTKDSSFITYLDSAGSYLIYHGKCGTKPQFITDSLILEPGCKNPIILDISGEPVKSLPITGEIAFAGAAQNGSRFALQIAKYSSQHTLQSERFLIYSTETWKPVAEVNPDFIGDQQSWTAFSPDGSKFIVGSTQVLTLYRLP